MKKNQTVLLFVLLSSLLISSCAPSSTPGQSQPPMPEPTPTSPAPADKWTIRMTHSGGIMGISRSIEVSSDGTFTIVDNRANKSVTGELPADKLSKLEEQVMALESMSASRPDGMNCADCFIYDLEVHRSRERFTVQLNDFTLPGSGYELFINQLLSLMDTALE